VIVLAAGAEIPFRRRRSREAAQSWMEAGDRRQAAGRGKSRVTSRANGKWQVVSRESRVASRESQVASRKSQVAA
jgi:hypothetical protein